MHFTKVKGVLSSKNTMNLFRGCTHGCIYCDSRSNCYKINHKFEDVEIKENALEILESNLRRKKEKCMISLGSMTDPYIKEELKLNYTREALKLINKYGFGITMITKSNRVLRDLDLLKEINSKTKCVVQMTLTTYDEKLSKIIEPNVSTTKERFETLLTLKDYGIPTIVWLTPILPYINDTEENLLGVLNYCKKAKVKAIICFGMGLTLRGGSREYFYAALDRYFTGLKAKYIREFSNNYYIISKNNYNLMNIFHEFCNREHIMDKNKEIFKYLEKFEEKYASKQLNIFDF